MLLTTTLMISALASTPSAAPSDSNTSAFGDWFEDELVPWCIGEAQTGTFRGVDKVDLAYASFTDSANTNGTLIISTGRTESWVKYCETVWDLQDQGMNIWIIDHRGQGFSDRMLSNTDKGYVEDFSDYVKDFTEFVEDVVGARSSDDVYILAHSMGGAIATHYVADNQDMVDGFILSAPMFEIDTPPLTETMAYWAAWAALWWYGESYIPGGGDYAADYTFEENGVTNSVSRHNAGKYLESTYPAIQMGSATYSWLYESIDKTIDIDDLGCNFHVPTLLLQAGQDARVMPDRQDDFCANASDCEVVEFSAGFHELLNDQDSVRDAALSEVKGFLSAF